MMNMKAAIRIASQKEVFLVISHYGAVQLLIYSACMDLIVTDTKI